jgi:hypothetical protein
MEEAHAKCYIGLHIFWLIVYRAPDNFFGEGVFTPQNLE